MATLIDVLYEFADQVPGFLSCSVADRSDGTPVGSIASSEVVDIEAVDAYFTEMLDKNEVALRALGLADRTEDILTTTETALFVSRVLSGTQYFWTVATNRQGALGLSRAIMRKFEARVVEALP